MTSKLLGSFIVFLIISVTVLPLMNTAFAQTPSNTLKFSTKGIIAESSNFHGAIMWSIINGDKGAIIVQSPAGRALTRVSVSSSTACATPASICLLSTVTDAGQSGVFKVGDTARFSVDLNASQQTVSILSGTLAGFDVTVNLSKIWNKTPVSAITSGTNSTVPTSTNSTTVAAYVPKHLSISLSESVDIKAHN
ncbi:MAG: hypothetical protein KGI28_06810 [Thaumarchaeota archaeon]|nr:hypothetical protein [Nitrososphaerota archaeon]